MYLVIGANGFLGAYMIKAIINKTSESIVATTRDLSGCEESDRLSWKAIDITSEDGIRGLAEITKTAESPVKIVFLAAYHHPDLVQKNPRLAWDTNVVALARAINAMENVACLFYSSTDSVYGESRDLYRYRETDPLQPVNTYGKQKVVAEAVVCGYGYHVARFPFLIGPSLFQKKKHFYDTIAETITSGNSFEMFRNSYRSTLHFAQAADLLIELMEKHMDSLPQRINICGDEDLSKYDVGIRIAKHLGVSPSLIRSADFRVGSGVFETPRAESTVMDNSLLKSILGRKEIKLAFSGEKSE